MNIVGSGLVKLSMEETEARVLCYISNHPDTACYMLAGAIDLRGYPTSAELLRSLGRELKAEGTITGRIRHDEKL